MAATSSDLYTPSLSRDVETYSRVLYHAVMPPWFLQYHARLDDAVPKGDRGSNLMELKIPPDTNPDDSLISIRLLEPQKVRKYPDDIIIKIKFTCDKDKDKYDPIRVVVGDGVANDDSWNQHKQCIGFEIRDPSEYHTVGPYIGIEGKPGEQLTLTDILETDKELVRGHVDAFNARWPQVYEMTILPYWKWGSCSSPIAGGHSISAIYQSNLNLREYGLFLEIYRGKKEEQYRFDSIEVMITENAVYGGSNF
jgi:hypothetical protein